MINNKVLFFIKYKIIHKIHRTTKIEVFQINNFFFE